MILSLVLPRVGEQMRSGRVRRLLASPGDPLRPGTPVAEISVDLGATRAQDCPPVFHFRLISSERGHLRAWSAAVGDEVAVGARLGVVTSGPEEPVDGAVARALRTASVAVQVDPLAP